MPAAGAGPRPERRLTGLREALVAAAGRPADLDLLPAALAASADGFLADLLHSATDGDPSGICLVAVGGYGRRELHPGSDLDVVLVHRQRRDVDRVAAAVWYPIWDDGTPLDQSVRTVREALAVARDDLRAALGLLTARVVAGDPRPGEELVRRAVEVARERSRDLLRELDAAVVGRHDRHGEVAFLLEPELKEGRGGLRDVHALLSAGIALPQLSAALGVADLDEPAAVLRRTRTALHVRTGRRGDRLSLEEQDGVADLFGAADADALMAAVASAAREVAWASDEGWRRIRSWLAGPRGRAGGRDRPLAAGVVLRDGEVTLAAGPGEDALLLRAAGLAASEGAPMAPALLARMRAAAQSPAADPWPEEVRHAFLVLLGGRAAAVPVLEALDRARFLEHLIPEWTAVRSRPQRNAYHRFTVDRHLLEAVAQAGDLVRTVARPDLLLVGALLHDIGKGFPGDHTEAGTALAPTVAARMGFDEADAATITKLVRLHLLLPDVATRRDLDDPATIAAVADGVGDHQTLDLLAALTRADGKATGPAAWGSWKAGLVDDLVGRVAAAIGRTSPAPAPAPAAVPPQLEAALAAGDLAVLVDGDASVTSVTVVGPDRTGLLAIVAGVLALHGLGVRTATGVVRDGTAVERFGVEPGAGGLPPAGRLLADLRGALDGSLLLEARLSDLGRAYAGGAHRAGDVPRVVVEVDNSASRRATLVEVRARDARGLLHALALVLARHGLDIASAHVSTLGHDVVDTFYVTTPSGKLTDGEATARLREALAAAAAGHGA